MDVIKNIFAGSIGETESIALITGLVILVSALFFFAATYAMKTSKSRTPDRDVLKGVFETGGGPNWEVKYSENWCKAEKSLGEWAGIEAGFANGEEHVLELIMRGNRMFTGPFPNLFPLVNLKSIDLDHCKLSGPIPKEIGNLIHLTYLNLSFNEFTGGIPEEIGNLQYLTFLNLNRNPLGGKIPTTIQYMSNLEYLWMANCQLTGPIPLEIGHLTELRDLILCENKLTGKIPHEIGVMSKLDRLILSMNDMSGRIPASLGQCKALTLLYLDRNNFTSQLPVEVAELPNLQELWLYRTNITIDGQPVSKRGQFLSDRLPGVEVVVEQPSTPSKVLVRKDNYTGGAESRMR
mmetsp:Transcript_22546/g.32954  ORF Transcript_22546/g.32954 Transcript_22546/m.32954 type:complete len:350 (-) Transcript_22546:153-1202(-)